MTTANLAIVVAGGEQPDARIAQFLPRAGTIIGADSGLDHALGLGLVPTMLVGDLDSISASGLHWAQEHDIPIHRHPADKDSTDLELALAMACETHDEVLVIDASIGRFDHAVGNLLLLGSQRWEDTTLSAVVGNSWLTVIRGGPRPVGRSIGDVVSLFAVHGDATGVTTTGLRWPLENANLRSGSSRGISNEVVELPATVEITSGVVFAIQPLALDEPGSIR